MSEEFVPATEEQPPGLRAFLDDTRKLFDEMDKKAEKPPETPVEPEKPAETPELPSTPSQEGVAKPMAEPSAPAMATPEKEQTGFIKDWKTATPEDFQKRISYLYAKDKENARQWAEARELLKKQREELETVRKETAQAKLAQSEAQLDDLQLKVVQLLDRNNPDYNPAEGARLLRELTNRDLEIKTEREAEKKRQEAFQAEIKTDETQRNIVETKTVLDSWAAEKAYAQPGHPLYPKVVEWIKTAYEKAPPEITVQQIVQRASQIFDAQAVQTAEKSLAPGADGQKLTVSAVLGTQGTRTGQSPSDRLSPRQRQIAEKLFLDESAGITRAKAYEMYEKGMDR
jgi:hypothetical protein